MTGEAKPEPGFYRIRMVKGGPWVPVRIVAALRAKRRRVVFYAYLGDKVVDIDRVWPRAYGNKIEKSEWEYMLKLGRWASAYEPDNPAAQPTKAVDLNKQPSLF